MPKTYTKAELNKLLSAERKKIRSQQIKQSDVKLTVKQAQKDLQIKHRHSVFLKRSSSIYTNQKNRMRKETARPTAHLPYTLEQFRQMLEPVVGSMCPYIDYIKLTFVKLTVDHKIPVSRYEEFGMSLDEVWGLGNLIVCSVEANRQKGLMTDTEFLKLMKGARKVLAPVAFQNFTRRLSMGGKWLSNGGR